jgi:rubrerythrin
MIKINLLTNNQFKQSFLNEIQKIADSIAAYKCPSCGFIPKVKESDQTPYCPKCGASMNNGPGYETRTNS